jgi:adenylate cyclase
MMPELDRIDYKDHGNLPTRRPRLDAEAGRPEAPRSAFAVVLFADIVGFTRLCEVLDPADAFALLADFHRRMARTIAAHAAAIDDYIGDSVMAVWSGAEPGKTEALRALYCGFAMLETIKQWNRDRARQGGSAVRVGIGMHAGTVMIGHTGNLAHAKLGAFGDTVNVANRLERMTRTYRTDLIVSDDFFRTVAAIAPCEDRLTRFRAAVKARIPGRTRPVLIRTAASV